MLSYLIRMVQGIGAAAVWTSNLAILMARSVTFNCNMHLTLEIIFKTVNS